MRNVDICSPPTFISGIRLLEGGRHRENQYWARACNAGINGKLDTICERKRFVKWENLFSALVQTHTPTEQRLSLGLLHTREKFSQKERKASVRAQENWLPAQVFIFLPAALLFVPGKINTSAYRERTEISFFASFKVYLDKALNYVCSA
jgi:hypothetical protein